MGGLRTSACTYVRITEEDFVAQKRRRTKRVPPKAVRIAYVDPDRVPISYANNFYVNHNEHEFVLTLAEVAPPATLHMTDEELADLDHVEAVVTTRIAMSPSRFKEFVSIMSDNLATWDTAYGEGKRQRK